jgi:hypothetical protein
VFPAAISPASFLSGRPRVIGEGDGSGNHRAVVHRVGRRLPRSRVCSPVLMAELGFAGGERGVPLRRGCLGGVGEAEESTLLENKFCPPLLHTGGVLLQRLR